jgi:hypothetical protein
MKKVWIYQSSRKFTDSEKAELEKILQEFTSRWASHGRKLDAEFEIPYNHFIVLKVDENAFNASGCSIDESVRVIKELEQKFNISLFDRQKMAYMQNDDIKLVPLNEITALYKKGTLSEETPVFNNLVENDEDFRSKWQQAFGKSLYKRFL